MSTPAPSPAPSPVPAPGPQSRARQLQRQALARRLQALPAGLPEEVQAQLRALLQARAEAAPAQPAPTPAPVRQAVRARPPVEWPRITHASDELASVARFRRAWSRTRAQDSVLQATLQRPPNAGPLNSQVLVLESLALMHALPGDYLRRFVGHVESLLWLQAAAAQAGTPPARRGRKPA